MAVVNLAINKDGKSFKDLKKTENEINFLPIFCAACNP